MTNNGTPATKLVKVSAASMRLPFNGCEPDYIRQVCKGACCRTTTDPSGVAIPLLPEESVRMVRVYGARVAGDRLLPVLGAKRCPFQGKDDHLCGVHGTEHKPFGCRTNPFTLNDKGTLIVRNRHKMLKCYGKRYEGNRCLPAYVAFRGSLDVLFGATQAADLVAHLEAGGGDLTVPMLYSSYLDLVHLHGVRHPGRHEQLAL